MNKINERLKELRKKEGLSQRAFGKKIFLSQDQISLLEKGRRTLTERSINDICREFCVNKDWLVYGIGEIFTNNKYTCNHFLFDENTKELIRKFNSFDDESKKIITMLIDKFYENKK